MRRNNLGIEKMCSWGAVEKDPVYVEIDGQKVAGDYKEEIM